MHITLRQSRIFEAAAPCGSVSRAATELHLTQPAVSTANDFLPNLIAHFTRRHPGVRVSLQVANRQSVLSALADNSTDLTITGRPPESVDVLAQDFMDNPLVVIAAPGHPLAAQEAVPLHRRV
jgi:DNA-binding transcriptional LysR family regulator